jgi:hypothetical protein
MKATNTTKPRTSLPGSINRYQTADGSIDLDKVVDGLHELGLNTTPIVDFLNSLDKEEQL